MIIKYIDIFKIEVSNPIHAFTCNHFDAEEKNYRIVYRTIFQLCQNEIKLWRNPKQIANRRALMLAFFLTIIDAGDEKDFM